MRIRSIKPEFFRNDQLAELNPLTRLFFIGLWTLADVRGRLEDRPKRIKASILPYDDCDAELTLQELNTAGFIRRYSAGGMDIIQVVNFEKHQRISGKEADTESEFPPENEQGITGEASGKHPRKHENHPLKPRENGFQNCPEIPQTGYDDRDQTTPRPQANPTEEQAVENQQNQHVATNETGEAPGKHRGSTWEPGREGKGKEGKGNTLAADGGEGGGRFALAGDKPEPVKPKPRERDPVFDALAAAEGSNIAELTKSHSKTIAVALAQIRQACPDVTAEEIAARAARYRVELRGATLTATALAKFWARCGCGPKPGPTTGEGGWQ